MVTVGEAKERLEEMVIRNLKEEAQKLKVTKESIKFVYLTSIFIYPMDIEAIQCICNEICIEDKFTKTLADLTGGLAVNPKLSCWPNGKFIDINLIFTSAV